MTLTEGLWKAFEMYMNCPANKENLERFFYTEEPKAPVLSIYDNIVDMRKKLREYPEEEWHSLLNLYSIFYKEVNTENKRRTR